MITGRDWRCETELRTKAADGSVVQAPMFGLCDECSVVFFCCYVLFLYVLFSCLPTPRPLGGGKQNRLSACTIFSLWLYIFFLPNMLLWRYIFRQAGAQLRVGGGAWAFFFFGRNLDCGFWIGEFGLGRCQKRNFPF